MVLVCLIIIMIRWALLCVIAAVHSGLLGEFGYIYRHKQVLKINWGYSIIPFVNIKTPVGIIAIGYLLGYCAITRDLSYVLTILGDSKLILAAIYIATLGSLSVAITDVEKNLEKANKPLPTAGNLTIATHRIDGPTIEQLEDYLYNYDTICIGRHRRNNWEDRVVGFNGPVLNSSGQALLLSKRPSAFALRTLVVGYNTVGIIPASELHSNLRGLFDGDVIVVDRHYCHEIDTEMFRAFTAILNDYKERESNNGVA